MTCSYDPYANVQMLHCLGGYAKHRMHKCTLGLQTLGRDANTQCDMAHPEVVIATAPEGCDLMIRCCCCLTRSKDGALMNACVYAELFELWLPRSFGIRNEESSGRIQSQNVCHRLLLYIWCCLCFTWSCPVLDSLGEILAVVATVLQVCCT